MPWNQQAIESYHRFTGEYISTYNQRIDCADLAIVSLVDFASANSLPVRLKYRRGDWRWYEFDPSTDNPYRFKNLVMTMLGTLNVIDNTRRIQMLEAKPGDLIMTRWSASLGHTRIIYSTRLDSDKRDYEVVWYQGQLPPEIPKRRTGYFTEIESVYENAPRRWNFSQFDE